jgi:hypothetical protein
MKKYLKLQDELFLLRKKEEELTEQLTDIWNTLTDDEQKHIESLPQPFSLNDPRTYLDRLPTTFDENDPMFIQQPK